MAFDNLQEKLTKMVRNIQGKGKLSERNMEEALQEIRIALLEADVNYKVAKDMLTTIREKSLGEDVVNSVEPGQLVVKIVSDEIKHLLGDSNTPINYQDDFTTIMICGLQGTGKTTSLVKLANIAKNKENKKPMIIAADLIRPAAIEQIKILAKSVNIEVFSKGNELNAVDTVKQGLKYAKDNNYDTVFIDTAGRLHIDDILMNELVEIKDIAKPNEILLTVDALTGQDIVNVASIFNEKLSVSGLIVTKMDGDAKGGGILSVKAITNVPVKFSGVGEKIEDLEPFYPERLADRILGMGDVVSFVEKAQEKIDMKKAEEAAQKLMSGKFTMDDLLAQFDQIEKLGSFSSIMKMLPGTGDLVKQINDDDASKQMKKSRAIIQSMTKYEKEFPEDLRNSHKKRIANGSGTTVNDVTKLVSQFEKSKKMMKQFSMLQKPKGF